MQVWTIILTSLKKNHIYEKQSVDQIETITNVVGTRILARNEQKSHKDLKLSKKQILAHMKTKHDSSIGTQLCTTWNKLDKRNRGKIKIRKHNK